MDRRLLEVIVEIPDENRSVAPQEDSDDSWICCKRVDDDFILCKGPCCRGFVSCYVISMILGIIGILAVIGLGFWTVWKP